MAAPNQLREKPQRSVARLETLPAAELPIQALFGLLKSERSVPHEAMAKTVRERALARFHDRG